MQFKCHAPPHLTEKSGKFQTLRNDFTARVSQSAYGVREKVMFIFGNVCQQGEVPHPIILPTTGPMSFLGGYPSDWSQVPSRGYPSPRQGGTGLGTPKTGWGTPLERTGPRNRLRLDRLRRGQNTSCGFPQEDCLDNITINKVNKIKNPLILQEIIFYTRGNHATDTRGHH